MPQVANILTRALQTESLSADTDRLINDVLFGEGGVVDVVGDSFEVTQDTGANMQITVGSGAAGDKAVVVRDGRAYLLEHQDASIDLAISAADADDDRIDLVVVRVYDDEADNSGNTYGDIEVIEGTPASSPSVPATPDGAIAIASILVAEDATAITDSDITDLRAEAKSRLVPNGLVQLGATVTDGDTGAADTWEDWGSAINLGNPGRKVTIVAHGAGSVLSDGTLTISGRLRVAISLDGGSSYTTGNETWIGLDNQTGVNIRRNSAASILYRSGTPTGNVMVKLQRFQSGGSAAQLNFNNGYIAATMCPAN